MHAQAGSIGDRPGTAGAGHARRYRCSSARICCAIVRPVRASIRSSYAIAAKRLPEPPSRVAATPARSPRRRL